MPSYPFSSRRNLAVLSVALVAAGCSTVRPAPSAQPVPPPRVTFYHLQRAAEEAHLQQRYADCAATSEVLARRARQEGALPDTVQEAHLWAARCRALQGQVEEAFQSLEAALEAGWTDADALTQEQELTPLHGDTRWGPLVAAARARAEALPQLPPPGRIGLGHEREGRLLAALAELEASLETYKRSMYHGFLLQKMGWLYSYLGETVQALRVHDESSGPEGHQGALAIDSSHEARDAVEVIAKAAERHQLVLLNEAHHMPLHRAFALRLLRPLWERGFRYLAMESLDDEDTELNTRGYPLKKSRGYLQEPVYSELVRSARALGFQIVPYEYIPEKPCNAVTDPVERCQNVREQGQARNIQERILRQDPRARVFVYAGYGHIREEKGSVIPMAVYLKELTGLDPLTIDQTTMVEMSEPKYENPFYLGAVEQRGITRATVFVGRDGSYWKEPVSRYAVDMFVFHPRTRLEHGRPEWMKLEGARTLRPLPAEVCTGPLPCMVEVFLEREGLGAMPVDRVVVREGQERPWLALPRERVVVVGSGVDGAPQGHCLSDPGTGAPHARCRVDP